MNKEIETISYDKDSVELWIKDITEKTKDTTAWLFIEGLVEDLKKQLNEPGSRAFFVATLVGRIYGRLDVVNSLLEQNK